MLIELVDKDTGRKMIIILSNSSHLIDDEEGGTIIQQNENEQLNVRESIETIKGILHDNGVLVMKRK